MIEKRSAEEWLAELDEILSRYRSDVAKTAEGMEPLRHEALARLRKLGFTPGEGLRLLRPARRR